MLKTVIRVAGVLLGLFSIGTGVLMIFEPVFGTWLEKLNIITFLIMGTIFVHYGLTGKSIGGGSRRTTNGKSNNL